MSYTRFALPAIALLATPAWAEPPKVVTDIAPVHSLVAQVMGDLGSPELLVSASDTPHSFSMRPSQAQALENADLIFWIGHALTPWLEQPLDNLASNATAVELLEVEGTKTMPFRNEVLFNAGAEDDHDHDEEHADHHDDHGDEHAEHHDDHGEEHADEHDGHDHDGDDPHAWLDPQNAAVWLSTIADALAEAEPENAATYRANADAATAQLDTLQAELAETLAPAKDQQFVVFHDAYHYFEDRFGLTTLGAISLGDAQAPSPQRLQTLRAELSAVDCVFTEPQFNPDLVATLVEGTGIGSATLDPLGANLTPGPGLYAELMRTMAGEISGCTS
ncbi:zinc transport system substrate-binding protein [Litoreibacter ponti]|uniref:High-affinity zinc uptake system protein ZnuA n=1 Tax=Litoreibacter ponti TaxID=1510457 RepID=A0A2T6BE36_9RHOB|nr:zinc ABC transporter substrate-binding protein [Litoreibacter ponti]PTX54315.1 zinc transport system substrate-binding protein [Litoreibacter ponti]